MKRLMTTLALVLALPLAASAQQGQGQGQGQMHGQMQQGMHQQGMGQGMMGMHQGMMQQGMPGMMGAMAMTQPGPMMILRLRSTLGLSDDQASQLRTIQSQAHEGMMTHQQAAQEARMRAHQAMMGADPDLDAFQSALEEAAQHSVQAMVVMARAHVQALDVLNDDQTAQLHTLMQAMQEMHQGQGMMHGDMDEMDHGGMEHEDGMNHGGMNHSG